MNTREGAAMTDLSLRERLADYGVSGDEMDAGGVVDLIVAWLSDNGLAIVPVKITPEMIQAAMLTVMRENKGLEYAPFAMMTAMVKAAPPAADLLAARKDDHDGR